MVLVIQAVGLLGVVGMLFYTYLQHRRSAISNRGYLVWNVIWLGLGVVVVVPSLFYPLMDAVGFPSTADFIFSVGVFTALAGLLVLHSRVTRLQQRLDTLVEDDAVDNPLRDAEE